MIPINLAVEDQLSETVLERLLKETGRPYQIHFRYNRGGYGYLKRTIPGFNNAAKGIPFLVLTDLNANECVPDLIADWLPHPIHPNLIFRVAIREVEAWLLADRPGFARFLGISHTLIPSDAEGIVRPKECIVQLARRCRNRKIREAIIPSSATAKRGPDYNPTLQRFALEIWDVQSAANKAPSLDRCIRKLQAFNPTFM